MRKIFTLFAALLCGLALNAKTIYLNSGGSSLWEADGVDHFAVWHWQGAGQGQWTGWMSRVSGNIWSVEVAETSDKVIFARFSNETAAPSWDDNWGQTDDLTPGSNNLFTITGWQGEKRGAGEWSVYNGGDPVTPQPGGAKDYYIRGFFNGTDTSVPTAEELFENGILADFAFTGDDGKGYFYVMVCDEGALVGRDYMLSEYAEGGTHVTLYDKESTGKAQKWGIPVGTVTFYLYDNGDGTLELSIEQLPGKTLVGGGQGIENTPANAKAHKTIIDGQLRIIRGDKMFDATGRQL